MSRSPPGSGAATSINAMKFSVDWARGVITLGPFEQPRFGDGVVARADWTRYSGIRGWELDGHKVKERPTVAAPTPSAVLGDHTSDGTDVTITTTAAHYLAVN